MKIWILNRWPALTILGNGIHMFFYIAYTMHSSCCFLSFSSIVSVCFDWYNSDAIYRHIFQWWISRYWPQPQCLKDVSLSTKHFGTVRFGLWKNVLFHFDHVDCERVTPARMNISRKSKCLSYFWERHCAVKMGVGLLWIPVVCKLIPLKSCHFVSCCLGE